MYLGILSRCNVEESELRESSSHANGRLLYRSIHSSSRFGDQKIITNSLNHPLQTINHVQPFKFAVFSFCRPCTWNITCYYGTLQDSTYSLVDLVTLLRTVCIYESQVLYTLTCEQYDSVPWRTKFRKWSKTCVRGYLFSSLYYRVLGLASVGRVFLVESFACDKAIKPARDTRKFWISPLQASTSVLISL